MMSGQDTDIEQQHQQDASPNNSNTSPQQVTHCNSEQDRKNARRRKLTMMGLATLAVVGATAATVISLNPSLHGRMSMTNPSVRSLSLMNTGGAVDRPLLIVTGPGSGQIYDNTDEETPPPKTSEPTTAAPETNEPTFTPKSKNTPEPTVEWTSEPTQPKTAEPTYPITAEPTKYPTKEPSAHPTASPAPTQAPTLPQMGCRRDRFDNEGNLEENNKLYMGQYVCSDDADQTYWFGLDPDTADLIWYNSTSGHKTRYYINEWHRAYVQKQQDQRQRRRRRELFTKCFGIGKNMTNTTSMSDSIEDEVGDISQNLTVSVMVEDEDEENEQDLLTFQQNEGDEAVAISKQGELEDYNCTEEDLMELGGGEEIDIIKEEEELFEDYKEEEVETMIDYYFDLSTTATFRIHRITRTLDYRVVDSVVHWEMPSKYDINVVDEDCLFTHDCPYMHLHQDGVMVLAWKEKWQWMEKNIKRCYDFETPDCLIPCNRKPKANRSWRE